MEHEQVLVAIHVPLPQGGVHTTVKKEDETQIHRSVFFDLLVCLLSVCLPVCLYI